MIELMKNLLKKLFFIVILIFPSCANAVAPIVIKLIAGGVAVTGFSIYRSNIPVNFADAVDFFSSCWSCSIFSNIIQEMSLILPKIYSSIGNIFIPLSIALTFIWFAWNLLSGYISNDPQKKWAFEPWSMVGDFGTHFFKLGFVTILLAFPLPRLVTDILIEPVINIGFSVNNIVSSKQSFAECVVASAISDPSSSSISTQFKEVYSPKLRHSLDCEIAKIHQITGIGIASGWAMMNMAFDSEYMYKIMWGVPVFPNMLVFFSGLLIFAIFIFALIPIPFYILQVFFTLSVDLIMLPITLLSWLFKGWNIVDWGGKSIQDIINDTIKNILGIVFVCLSIVFSMIFIDSMFSNFTGLDTLQKAIDNNDISILMDGLLMNNDSFITIIFLGIFFAMFMTLIPEIIKMLFKNVAIPKEFYERTREKMKIFAGKAKKYWELLKK